MSGILIVEDAANICEITLKDCINRENGCENCSVNYIYENIEYLASLHEQGRLIEQKHGYWKPIKVGGITTLFSYSICQRKIEIGNDYYGKPTRHVASHYPYCHCGAKMDEE